MSDRFLSPRTFSTLAQVISGGSQSDRTPSIGIYRSAAAIERFMRACNEDFQIGAASRLPALENHLIRINQDHDGRERLTYILEQAANPADFSADPDKFSAVMAALNQVLAHDGLELRLQGRRVRLMPLGRSTPMVDQLAKKAEVIDFDTVSRDLGRALDSADSDPEDAVTAACSTVESVCRSVLVELGLELPAKKDIQGLYRAVRDPLGLSPERPDLPAQIADDIRKILGGLSTAVEGLGALRTHGGDAHGRERGFSRIDARIARLAIHTASTLALFIIETWERKFPAKPLHRH